MINNIDLAKENGSWDALNNSDNLVLPPELIAAFEKNQVARDFFEQLSDSSKKMFLGWIYSAKTDPSRLKRISQTVTLCEQGKRSPYST